MNVGRLAVCGLAIALSACAADLVIQGGQAIPPGNWVQINTNVGYQPDYNGFDKLNWVPALKRACIYTTYRTESTEPDHTYSCYSFSENNWIILYQGHMFHDEHGAGGHNEGGWAVDPTTSISYGPTGFSGTQPYSDLANIPIWKWDFLAQSGTGMLGPVAPSEGIQEPNTYFDPVSHRFIMHGGGGTTNTAEYDPNLNILSTAQATTGSAPGPSLRSPSVFYRVADGKGYYIFGQSGTTISNAVNAYYAPTHTWELVTPSGTPPPARMDGACAYSIADDAALCTGGYNHEDPPGGQVNFSDTWVLDFAGRVTGCGTLPCWVQLSPSTPLQSFPAFTVWSRMYYDTSNDVFVLANANVSAAARFNWAYRFNPGPNAGWAGVTPSVAYPPTAGSLNRNISGGTPTVALSTSLVASASTVYYSRTEGSGPSDGTSSGHYQRPYVSQNVSGVITDLPNPSAFSSIAPDVATGTVEVNEPTIMLSGTTPWIAFSQWNGLGQVPMDIVAKSFNGTSWSGGNIGRGAECTSTDAFCQQHAAKIIDANGFPTIAYIQTNRNTASYQDVVTVKQLISGTWTLLGGFLNIGYTASNIKTIADRPSIASDGTANPWVAWTEYTLTTQGSPQQDNVTNAKMYLSHWTGSAWATQCGGTGNVLTTTGYASYASVTVMGGVPYVAYTERGPINSGTANDINKLYVRKCQAGTWSTVGSVYLNRDQAMGWVYRPEITNDGTNLWVTWDEQGNDAPYAQTYSLLQAGYGRTAQRVRVFVSQWNGTAWTKVGGSLNADPANGIASRAVIAMQSSTPVVAWGETVMGSTRQIYAKKWNGSDWVQLSASTPLDISTGSLPDATSGAAYSTTLAGIGGTPPYSWTVLTGALPTGLSLAGSTGVISGSNVTGTTQSFTIQLTDAVPNSTTQPLTITVNAAPTVTTASLPNGTISVAYSQTLVAANGTAPLTWSITAGALQSGLTLTASSGLIAGTPTVSSSNNITFTVTDANGATGNRTLNLTINSNTPVSSTIQGNVVIRGQGVRQ